jgi:hypothetical protein
MKYYSLLIALASLLILSSCKKKNEKFSEKLRYESPAKDRFEVNITWTEGKLVNAQLIGKLGLSGQFKYNGRIKSFEIPESGVYEINH